MTIGKAKSLGKKIEKRLARKTRLDQANPRRTDKPGGGKVQAQVRMLAIFYFQVVSCSGEMCFGANHEMCRRGPRVLCPDDRFFFRSWAGVLAAASGRQVGRCRHRDRPGTRRRDEASCWRL